MSVFGIDSGIPRSARVVLSDGNATTILDATAKSNLYLVGLLLTNAGGSSLTPTVDVYDGTTAFLVRDNASLSDQASENVSLPGFIHLKKGDTLRVTSASGLHVIASYIEVPANKTVG